MKRLWDGLTSVVFWILSPVWFLLLLIFAIAAWALGMTPRRER